MPQDTIAEVSEAEIAVHWQEEAYVHPPEKFVSQANLADQRIFDRFDLDNFPECFKEYADLLDWYKGTSHSIRPIRRFGDGSSVAGSTPAITASIAISPSTRTRRQSISSLSRNTKASNTSPTKNYTCG